MKLLVVTPYAPTRDGIAAYAIQTVKALLADGHDVTVLSPGPSAAHEHLDLRGPRGVLALARRAGRYDKVIVQFHPDMFFVPDAPVRHRAEVFGALLVLARLSRQLEFVVHEIDYRWGNPRTPSGRLARLFWHQVTSIRVHTGAEARSFSEAFGVGEPRLQLLAHGGSFASKTPHDRDSARASLGIPAAAVVFLSIGFVQPHKGFDRAVDAFRGLDPDRARLYVVGSVRVEEAQYVQYMDDLRANAESTPGATVVESYTSDELFDRWIVASDVVVLPYREIWSSSVVERAALHHRAVIVTDVGGLAEQTAHRDDVTVVAGDDELRAAMIRAVGGPVRVEEPAAAWPAVTTPGRETRDTVQAAVELRAAARRGGTLVSASDSPGAARDVARRGAAASAPVRRVPTLALPAPTSARPGAALLKKVLRRLTAWQLDPVVQQINALQTATVNALEHVAVDDAPAAPDDTRRVRSS